MGRAIQGREGKEGFQGENNIFVSEGLSLKEEKKESFRLKFVLNLIHEFCVIILRRKIKNLVNFSCYNYHTKLIRHI